MNAEIFPLFAEGTGSGRRRSDSRPVIAEFPGRRRRPTTSRAPRRGWASMKPLSSTWHARLRSSRASRPWRRTTPTSSRSGTIPPSHVREDHRGRGRRLRASSQGRGRAERPASLRRHPLDGARAFDGRDAPVAVRDGGGSVDRCPSALARNDVQVGGRAHGPRRREVGRDRRPTGQITTTVRGDGPLRGHLRRPVHHGRGRQRRRSRPPPRAAHDAVRRRPLTRGGGGGDPGPYTAYGCFLALGAALAEATGSNDFAAAQSPSRASAASASSSRAGSRTAERASSSPTSTSATSRAQPSCSGRLRSPRARSTPSSATSSPRAHWAAFSTTRRSRACAAPSWRVPPTTSSSTSSATQPRCRPAGSSTHPTTSSTRAGP